MSTLTDLFSDIADAIRTKTGSSEIIQASNFPTAISAIPSGSTVTVFNRGLTFVSSTQATCNISSVYSNYNSITMDNISCMFISSIKVHTKAGGSTQTFTWSYDSTTGVITVTSSSAFFMSNPGTVKIMIAE